MTGEQQTSYKRAQQSHVSQLRCLNEQYARGEIDISRLLQGGVWANHELSTYQPDREARFNAPENTEPTSG